MPFSRRKRTARSVEIAMISCAKRSAAWACSALRHLSFECQEHVPTTPAENHTGTTGVDL
jgi:hypothetical protein